MKERQGGSKKRDTEVSFDKQGTGLYLRVYH